jgi:hypothetical protein
LWKKTWDFPLQFRFDKICKLFGKITLKNLIKKKACQQVIKELDVII